MKKNILAFTFVLHMSVCFAMEVVYPEEYSDGLAVNAKLNKDDGTVNGNMYCSLTSGYQYYNWSDGEAITGSDTSDKVIGEGEVTYDVRFYAVTPDEKCIKLLLNVEAQKDYHPGYDLVTRGIFYTARMISSQLDTEFTADDYDGIKKVYSIQPEKIYGDFQGKAILRIRKKLFCRNMELQQHN